MGFIFYIFGEIFASYGNMSVEYRVDMEHKYGYIPRNGAGLMKTFLASLYFTDVLFKEEIQW